MEQQASIAEKGSKKKNKREKTNYKSSRNAGKHEHADAVTAAERRATVYQNIVVIE